MGSVPQNGGNLLARRQIAARVCFISTALQAPNTLFIRPGWGHWSKQKTIPAKAKKKIVKAINKLIVQFNKLTNFHFINYKPSIWVIQWLWIPFVWMYPRILFPPIKKIFCYVKHIWYENWRRFEVWFRNSLSSLEWHRLSSRRFQIN